MDTATQAWLISQLGTATDLTDLTARYARLGKARLVAIEVVNQRLADLRAQVASVTLSGVVSVGYADNIKAYERQLALLESGIPIAPDETAPTTEDDTVTLGSFQLVERRRR